MYFCCHCLICSQALRKHVSSASGSNSNEGGTAGSPHSCKQKRSEPCVSAAAASFAHRHCMSACPLPVAATATKVVRQAPRAAASSTTQRSSSIQRSRRQGLTRAVRELHQKLTCIMNDQRRLLMSTAGVLMCWLTSVVRDLLLWLKCVEQALTRQPK